MRRLSLPDDEHDVRSFHQSNGEWLNTWGFLSICKSTLLQSSLEILIKYTFNSFLDYSNEYSYSLRLYRQYGRKLIQSSVSHSIQSQVWSMAGDLTATEAAELQEFLHQNYNTPPVKWLEGLMSQFDALKALLEQGVDSTRGESNDGIGEQARTAATARAAALPVVRLLHRNFFIGMDEALPCYAIGTISPSTFSDIFWQKVDEVNSETQDAKMEVYVAHDGNFEFRFSGYIFQLLYLQSEDFARRSHYFLSVYSDTLTIDRYPEIVKEDPAWLEKRADADRVYREIVPNLTLDKLFEDLNHSLGPEPTRRAFYFLRAHAIERGIFYNLPLLLRDRVFLHAQYILGLLHHAVKSLLTRQVSVNLQGVIAECFHDFVDLHVGTDIVQDPIGRDLEAERTTPTMLPVSQSLLMRVRALPMDEKMDYPRECLRNPWCFPCSNGHRYPVHMVDMDNMVDADCSGT